MKYFFVFFLSICLVACSFGSYGHKHKYRGLPRTEVGLMNNVLGCLMNKDTLSYFNLFPPFDTLWSMVLHNPDRSPETVVALNKLKEHPQSLIQFDPYFNKNIIDRFAKVLEKGEDSGIHWNSLMMQRYELKKEALTRDLIGYDKICPERFKGYMFVRDMAGRLTFCITIAEIQKINGYFFGGQVMNILEASSIDMYIHKEYEERKYYEWLERNKNADSAAADSARLAKTDTAANDTTKRNKNLAIVNSTEDEKAQVRKQVIDRKYYEGKFDDEIPVKMYVRYLKDVKSGALLFYEGLYRFGDQVKYAKLNITKDKEGKWMVEDDPPIGTMELELANKVYTGSWTNNENGTGYDVVLKQADITDAKLIQLDNILEKGLYGRTDDEITDQPVKEGAEGDDGAPKSPKLERLEKKLKRQKEKEKERSGESQGGQEAKPKKKSWSRYENDD